MIDIILALFIGSFSFDSNVNITDEGKEEIHQYVNEVAGIEWNQSNSNCVVSYMKDPQKYWRFMGRTDLVDGCKIYINPSWIMPTDIELFGEVLLHEMLCHVYLTGHSTDPRSIRYGKFKEDQVITDYDKAIIWFLRAPTRIHLAEF